MPRSTEVPGEPVIACEDLWMVFGERAGTHLASARQSGRAPGEIAGDLAARGLIPAVRGISFEVAEGELFVVMGLSGSGKSTVIRCLSRLLEPTAGVVRIDGEDIMSASESRMIELRRRKMGMVFQHFGLFPHMTVEENVAFPLKVQGTPVADRLRRAHEVIELVGLAGREDAYPREMSGGQRQRVGIARSLAVNPELWFLDEPFSALDPLIRRQLQDEFLRLQAELRKSIVFITHDIAEALKLADRIAIMRDGEVVQIGTPAEIVLSPADAYVAEFTQEVPRGRMMTVDRLMEPTGEATPISTGAPPLRTGMTLDAALSTCASGLGTLPVSDGDGKVVGVVTSDALVRALGAQ